MSGKNYYTIAEAAKVLGVSESTIRRHVDGGSVKASKVLGRWRIDKSAIDIMVA